MRNKFVTFTLSILFQFGLAAAATADVLVAEEAAILRYNNSGVLQGVFNSGGPTPDGFSAMIRGGNGNVYALSGSSQVYEYDRFTGAYIRTFVDGSTQGFTDIKTMAFGRDGNFYLGTGDVGTVERYDGNTGAFLNTFLAAGAGAASGSQQLSEVMSLAFGTDGMLYVGNDSRRLGEGYSVLRFDATTGSFVDAIVADSANGLYDPNALVFGPDGKL